MLQDSRQAGVVATREGAGRKVRPDLVTDEMAIAGACVLNLAGVSFGPWNEAQEIARDVFDAMIQLAKIPQAE